MKKIAAMLLALCMLLAAVPALGEESGPAGNWYMTMADVTIGYILLNADGTAVVNISSEEDMTGTWTEGEGTVTVTVDGTPLDLAYDGASLSSDMLPLKLSREEGKVSMATVANMLNGGEYELPEGMTELDLMAIAMEFYQEYTELVGAESAGGVAGDAAGGAEPAASAETPNLTIVQSSYKTVESYSGYRGVYIAKVRNDNDVPLFITGGNLKLSDSEGNLLGEAQYLYTCGSKYLEPGEVSFVSMQADLAEKVEDIVYEAGIENRTESYYGTDTAVKVENPALKKAEGYEGDTLRATVINDTDKPLAGLSVIFVLEDAEGNLLQLSSEVLYRHELGAGSTITMVSSVDSRIAEYCEANGIEPAVVEAYAWVEN